MRNKTKAAVTINRLGEKQGEGGGGDGGFLGITWFSGGNGEERGRDFPPPRPFLQATNNEYSVIMTF